MGIGHAVIDVSPTEFCIGDRITFTISGVEDPGGVKRLDCFAKEPIAPVVPTLYLGDHQAGRCEAQRFRRRGWRVRRSAGDLRRDVRSLG